MHVQTLNCAHVEKKSYYLKFSLCLAVRIDSDIRMIRLSSIVHDGIFFIREMHILCGSNCLAYFLVMALSIVA